MNPETKSLIQDAVALMPARHTGTDVAFVEVVSLAVGGGFSCAATLARAATVSLDEAAADWAAEVES
jgi:hypothetical protein